MHQGLDGSLDLKCLSPRVAAERAYKVLLHVSKQRHVRHGAKTEGRRVLCLRILATIGHNGFEVFIQGKVPRLDYVDQVTEICDVILVPCGGIIKGIRAGVGVLEETELQVSEDFGNELSQVVSCAVETSWKAQYLPNAG